MKEKRKLRDYYKIFAIIFITAFLVAGFIFNKKNSETISSDLKWSERMALSVMQRNPEPWQLEFNDKPKWSYTHGLVLSSFIELSKKVTDQKYYEYAERYANIMVEDDGSIQTYDIADFNIDHLSAGNVVLTVYQKTKDEKYLKALQTLRKQIEWQPRTTDGGFWHKLRYPWQMWLDGLYMGSPFYLNYSLEFDDQECLDDIVNQFVLMEKHARDPKSGLLYHGWDESAVQEWADPETGLSENFWGRAIGWYAMALVDVLESLPKNHSGRGQLSDILNRLVEAIVPYQDKTGLWYQVVDMGEKDGNYLEASASCMFAYSIAKGVNLGVLDKKYWKNAEMCFDGIINNLIEVDENGAVSITNVCSVAGLGGNPYRDGSFEYYISEPKRNNDPKATGPFILASIELDK